MPKPKDYWDQIQGGTPAKAPKAAKPRAVKGTQQAPSSPQDVRKQLIRLAARVTKAQQSLSPVEALTAEQTQPLRDALRGYNQHQLRQILDDAGVKDQAVRDTLLNYGHAVNTTSPAETVLDYASRPGQAVAGALTEGGGNPFSGKTWEGAWRGLSGEKQYSPTEAVLRGAGSTFSPIPGVPHLSRKEAHQAVQSLPAPVRFATEVAAGALIDPLTYVSFGTSAAGKEAITFGAEQAAQAGARSAADIARGLAVKGISSLSDAEKALIPTATMKLLRGARGGIKVAGRSIPHTSLRPISEAVAKPVERLAERTGIATVEKGLRTRAEILQAARRGEKWAPGVAQKLERAGARLEGSQALANQTLRARLQQLIRTNKFGSAEDVAQLRRGLEGDVTRLVETGGLNASQGAVRRGVRYVLDQMQEAEKAAGIGTKYRPDYLPHIALDPETQRVVEAIHAAEGLPKKFGGYTKARTLEGSIEDINTARAAQGAKALKFEENPIKAVMLRGIASNRDIAGMRYVDDLSRMTDNVGQPLLQRVGSEADLVAGKAAGLVDVKLPGKVGTVLVRPEIRNEVARVAHVLGNDAATHAFLRGFDRWLGLWKGYATVPFPFSGGFSFRNMMSNWFNASYLPERAAGAGVKDYVHAFKLQRLAAKGFRERGNPFAFLSPDEAQAMKHAFDTGSLSEGLFRTDIFVEKGVRPRLRDVSGKEAAGRVARRANPLSQEFGPLHVGQEFNSAIENNARLALFLHNYKALGPDGAAALVRKYLFDYGDLTPFEQNAIKRVVPFYTWTRKNLPLQLEALLKTPGRFSHIQEFRNALENEAQGQQTGPIPAWMRKDAGTLLPKDVENLLAKIPLSGFKPNTPAMLIPDLPYNDIADTGVPLVNLAAQLPGLNKILPKGQGAGPALQALFSNVGGPAGLAKSAAELATGKNLFTGQTYYPGQREPAPSWALPFGDTISPAAKNFWEEQWPLLSKLRTLFPTTPSDTETGARRRLSMLTGVNVWPLGPETQKAELIRRLEALDALRRELETTGVTVPGITELPGYKAPKSKKGKGKTTKATTPAANPKDYWDQVTRG